ncbi:universal stress protein [Haloplanus aerogenes]|uniref:Nucleotide-binding universal stress UspA family protein n=1 Tax=Haloplanus aerogenes TaxID=660522 RepID=A0A3M0D9I8_9EURY|nr:universal stress protein [Haloplanus aerogenes]AZH26186.1 universal stress protein [Haloplanus aerogenes]RMB18361.1 nucleotide-binding universal stress UspA family protein [Haloplanus aerogenes]
MATILLATDGSEDARQAASEAIDLAEEREATLHVICVVDKRRFGDPALSSAELATIYAEDHAELCVADVVAMAADRPVTVEGDTRHGIPHEVILDYAEEVDADTIVVGDRGDHAEHFSGVGRTVRERTDRDVIVVEAGA